jgi:predicted acyltransferase
MALEKGEGSARLASLDAYRGFVMLAMASGGAGLLAGVPASDGSSWSSVIGSLRHQLDHVAWRGCTFWDLIQPSFMFMVGVAMPFSYARRVQRGDSWSRMFGHVLLRSLILVLLAVFLASNGSEHTNYTFVNVLGQIGLGYTFVFLLLGKRPAVQLGAVAAILLAYWLFFALYPVPGTDFDAARYGANEPGLAMTGFFAHWNKNANAAAAFDRWFLNLFPQPPGKPFLYNEGGYATLNFIPSMATTLLGVWAGELLRSGRARAEQLRLLIFAGCVSGALGLLLDGTICPSIKRIWTPSWALISAAWTFWMLAAFYAVIDVVGVRRWSFPLAVVGMNSIAIYIMAQLMKPFVAGSVRTHLGEGIFDGPYGHLVRGSATLLVFWLSCYWLYRQKIFIKI